ncbi:MAG: ribulose-phosphate 3-epimerase [Prevotella sp.]
MATIISPSILSIDFADLRENIEMLNESEAEWIHLDIMDGVFVPNISFGFPVMKAISRLTSKRLDVHYMIIHPENYIQQTAKLGAYVMTVHAETCKQLHDTIDKIHAAGMKAGVSINPDSPLSMIEDVLIDADLILVMSVFPGFGGQKFIETSVDKVRELRKMIDNTGSNALIEVDGGIQSEQARVLVEAGADVLVAGSYVFNSDNPKKTIADLRNS